MSGEDQPTLVQSALAGEVAGVSTALETGTVVDDVEDGRTALHNAANEGHLDVVKVLLYWKADINKRSRFVDDNRGTALHLAAENGHTEILELLLSSGAEKEALDDKGRRATHRAASRGQLESLEVLHKYGCDLNPRDNGKATPIHHAAFFGDFDLVKWLVEHGVYIVLKDKNGRLPKDVAKKYGHNDVHRYLKESNTKRGGMFGGTKARRSMIETSNRQRAARDGSRSRPGSVAISEPLRRSQGPEPALRTQLSMDLMDSSQSQGDMPSLDDTSLVSTLKPSLQNARVASEPSLTPPDSPTRHMMDAKVEPRKRTWSLRSAKGRSSLKSMVDDLAEIKGRQDEELEYRAEEITQLKNQLSRLENEKSQMEDKVKQMRVHIDQQQHQLVDSVALQEQLQTLALENDQYQTSSRQKASMEAELVERDALNKHTIEALTKEVERLSHQLSSTEEKLQQSQEAIVSVAQQDTSAASKIESLTTEVEHLTYMLNDAGEKAIRAQEKLEQKIAALKKENELQKNTVTVLTERLREAEENDFSLQQLQEEKLVQLNQLVEQDKGNQLTITSLNTKIQTLVEQNNSNDSMINSLNAKIQEWEDQDNASQLTIASLNAKVQQLTHSINDQDHKTLAYHKQQHAKIEELTEKDESYQKTISALTRNVDQLSLKLKENQENLVWYQSQLQEVGDREAKAQNTIAGLRGEVDTLNQRLEEVQHSKTPLTQYERGGTVVALQKREAANKQTIKALENRLQHLTQKMTDSEQASLRVQREQLETITSLKTQMDQLRQYGTGSPNLLQKQQEEIIQKQKEESLKKDLIVETLNKKVEHYSAELQKNYANFSSWQAQQQEKDNEMQQHEAESQQTINKLRQQLNQLTHQRANGQVSHHQQQQRQMRQQEQNASTYSSLPHQLNHLPYMDRNTTFTK